jgi:chemotaxis protein MotB
MSRKSSLLIAVLFFVSALSGCVAKSDYLKKEAEANALAEQVASLSKDKEKLTKERNDLDKLLKAKSDDLTKANNDLRFRNADLEAQNTKLKQDVADLRKKEAEVQAESSTYKDLMKEMKAEVARGQITINELKGKLTVDVANQILFASGEAEVKKEGLAILKRVVAILATVKDKAIRIEGHTDNQKIFGQLAKRYPTNWELSAARAINVTKYLVSQGIPPEILSAVAYGEHKPLADNKTAEGRQKNRRIAIILLPKD